MNENYRTLNKIHQMEEYYFYFLLFTLPIFFIIIKFSSFLFNRNRNLPPGPLSLPIIGHLHLINKTLHEAFAPLLSRYGPILYLRFGSRPIVVLSSPSAVEECFTKNDVILANRPRTMAADHFSYNYTNYGFAPYGDVWRTLRRFTVVELLSSGGLQKYSAFREEEVVGLCRKLVAISGGERKVDLKFLLFLFTANIMLRVVAGKRGVEEGDSVEVEERFVRDYKDRFFPSMSMNLCDFVPILRKIGYGGIEKNCIKVHKMRDEYLQELVDQVRFERNKKPIDDDDDDGMKNKNKKESVIEALLLLQEGNPKFYSDDIIKSIILVLLIGGTDTSAVTLEWAMSLLLCNPSAMQKLKAEIDSNIGHDHLLNDSNLSKLPYLRCVVNETLRLYPPTPILLPHCPSESCTVEGYNIPQGAMVLVDAWAMHRDPNLWEDVMEFKPERFDGMLGERDGFKFVPFGAGRRACPGGAMGVRTVSLALGALVQCFVWKKCEEDEVDMSISMGVTMSKATPLEAVCYPHHNIVQLLSRV